MHVSVATRYSTLVNSKGADVEVSREVPEVIRQEMNLYAQSLGGTKFFQLKSYDFDARLVSIKCFPLVPHSQYTPTNFNYAAPDHCVSLPHDLSPKVHLFVRLCFQTDADIHGVALP